MAKTHKLSCTWEVATGVLSMVVEARDPDAEKTAAALGSFKRSMNFAECFGQAYGQLNEAGAAAIEFGAWTALRNSTGSCDTLAEAEEAVDRRLEAFARGEWGAEREGSAVPFTKNHALSQAVERATKGAQDAQAAAEKLNAMVTAACAANNLGEFARLEPTERGKLRKQIVDQIVKAKPAIGAALAQVEAERQAEAAKRKAAAAAKALAAAAGTEQEETGI